MHSYTSSNSNSVWVHGAIKFATMQKLQHEEKADCV